MAGRKGPFDAVQFTRESAERIASVVRSAELTPPAASPLTFDRMVDGRIPKQVRAATFSGAWPIGSSKVVTFTNAPVNTANVQNISWPITNSGYVNEPCVVGRDGTSWYLIVPRLQTATAVFVTQTQQRTFCVGTASQSVVTGVETTGGAIATLSDVVVTATLNTTDCSITVGVTKTTSTTNVVTGVIASTAILNTVSATASGVFIAGVGTASFLRIRVP